MQFLNHFCLFVCLSGAGVERLAGMSLHDPVKVDMSDGGVPKPVNSAPTDNAQVKPKNKLAKTNSNSKDVEVFATPEGLRHHFVIVPHKLRLVTLTAFLLMHCKVGGRIVTEYCASHS